MTVLKHTWQNQTSAANLNVTFSSWACLDAFAWHDTVLCKGIQASRVPWEQHGAAQEVSGQVNVPS